MSNRYKCWLVYWYNDGGEPTVTVFNNKEAADKCAMYFFALYDHVAIYQCPIYGRFISTETCNERSAMDVN